MKIKSLYLNEYGKFEGKKIELSDSLNIILGKNEAGKSTVMAFIRAMLYGFGDGRKHDRKKYVPWSGKKARGETDILTDSGEEIRLVREMGKTQAQDSLSAINIKNGENFEYNAENIIGIGEEAFLKSFYIRQLDTQISGENGEIEQKLINLAHSASQDLNYHSAIQTLENCMKKYRPFRGGGGLIKELEEKIANLNSELGESEERRLKMAELEQRSETLDIETEQCERKIKDIKRLSDELKTYEKFMRLEASIKTADSLRQEHDRLSAEAESLRAKVRNLSEYENTPRAILFTELRDTDALRAQIPKSGSATVPALLFVAAASCTGLGFLRTPAFAAAAVFAVLCTVFTVKRIQKKRICTDMEEKIKEAEEENLGIKSELERFGAKNAQEYAEKNAIYTASKARLLELEKQCDALFGKIAVQEAESAQIRSELGDTEKPDSPYTRDELLEEEALIEAQIREFMIEKSRIDALLNSETPLRTPDIILTERAEVVERLDKALKEYRAYSAAYDALKEAYSRISSDFTPLVNEKASEILMEITGKYDDIIADRNFSVVINHEGTKQLGYFSSGTVDQVYMALRLAVTDILFGTGKPLLLDDPFLTYDGEREENLMRYLKKRSEAGQQIIIFSCRDIASDGDVNTIHLT